MTQTTSRTIENSNTFDDAVTQAIGQPLHAATVSTFQVNIGLTCNLACHHCHVESSPARAEQMDWPTMQQVLSAAARANATTLDITGGAPEMNPHFRQFVEAAVHAGLHVIVRTNLTIMLADGYTDLPRWFADRGVHLVASLPCYLETNVDKQRGKHVYTESIDVIRRLNGAGYGREDRLQLDLVYNPGGPSLPPDQSSLEADYRRELHERFGISLHAADHDHEHADRPVPARPRTRGQSGRLHGVAGSQLQPRDGRAADVSAPGSREPRWQVARL
jgi:radical SAM/Cys-rich protein